jgi:hypothetical protein
MSTPPNTTNNNNSSNGIIIINNNNNNTHGLSLTAKVRTSPEQLNSPQNGSWGNFVSASSFPPWSKSPTASKKLRSWVVVDRCWCCWLNGGEEYDDDVPLQRGKDDAVGRSDECCCCCCCGAVVNAVASLLRLTRMVKKK